MGKEQNKDFQKLIDIWSLIIENRKCFWSNDQDILSILPCISSEVKELQEAIKTCDYGEIISEIGDILGLSIMLCFLAERDGICSISTIVEDQCDKIKRRAAYIFDPVLSERVTSVQEASQQWMEAKKAEKENKKIQNFSEDIIKSIRNILEKSGKELSYDEK